MSALLKSVDHINGEHWRSVPSYEGRYEVSDIGRVKSTTYKRKRPIILTPCLKFGYPVVCLCQRRKLKYVTVHRLVLLAFVGDPPEGMECAHLDGNSGNPRLDNLKWVTHAENISHKVTHGTTQNGISNPYAKLSVEEVLKIRELAAERKIPQRIIGHQFGIDQTHVSMIHLRKIWRHV